MGEPSLMWVKVLLLVAAGVAFFGWQFHDLARQKKARKLKTDQASAKEELPKS